MAFDYEFNIVLLASDWFIVFRFET